MPPTTSEGLVARTNGSALKAKAEHTPAPSSKANDGTAANVGQPYVKGATVELQVMEHRRGPKVIVYKMRPKKKTRRKNGHRQELTRVMVKSISVGGKALA